MSGPLADWARSIRGAIFTDAFLGSGTTLIAAKNSGHRRFGLELDPLYVDLIIRRLQATAGKEAVHAKSGLKFGLLA